MKAFPKPVLLLLLLALAAVFAGCTSPNDKYSSQPWDKTAGWEGQMPGMGAPTQGSGVR
ncbi:MAG TPA: hypothetical protein VK717_08075 [Opitutaceae bacterium]|jgi:hypothetical protein|nr:hypothetical protein [Opitutaceae bacterium]